MGYWVGALNVCRESLPNACGLTTCLRGKFPDALRLHTSQESQPCRSGFAGLSATCSRSVGWLTTAPCSPPRGPRRQRLRRGVGALFVVFAFVQSGPACRKLGANSQTLKGDYRPHHGTRYVAFTCISVVALGSSQFSALGVGFVLLSWAYLAEVSAWVLLSWTYPLMPQRLPFAAHLWCC